MPKSSNLPPTNAAVSLRVRGRVQGVGYRYFAEETALARGLAGWVRNLPDGNVEIEAEGPKALIDDWLVELRKGPPLARVENIEIAWHTESRGHSGFTIRP